MAKSNISDILRNNSYPGRGICIGLTPDGKKIAVAYFIMGRSENSRNRVFVAEGNDLRTKAFDDSKLTDPSLIIYYPVRTLEEGLIVTNGDQTDTIFDFVNDGMTFENALNTRQFEPDSPNFTPRISGIVKIEDGDASYKLSILKTSEGDANTSNRYYFDFDMLSKGCGHFIHTYQSDGDPLPSFEGEPRRIEIQDSIDGFCNEIWNSLNNENKVSLFVRYININSREFETRIRNVHGSEVGK
ncbi:MAG: IMP cyclohydrolase [Bacillota bacterium]